MCVLSQKAQDGKSSRPFTHFLKEAFTSISLLGDTCIKQRLMEYEKVV